MATLLASCTIGNGRICGPQTPRANCNKEMLDALLHPPKAITFWNQQGVNEEQKMQDWLACPGGTRNGGFGYDMTKQKPDETDAMTMRRLENNFYRCLIRKGYRYRACEVGKMLDEVICEAPPKP
ncbi:hypothetical protein LH452_14820 [Laribacter hongkongensis]|uniref:hypothetical protein n=1 Tax=Laribacter hongkongensis TaxID=168471 RepID=UPI001EFE52DA|nr:hypothetical protein [Laribacter hongkongensis]MCG9060159.1 hypothetical protein [Laribacter hongkongensis]MCG9087256.1 hypothetical protein [Laribacter hongkongensis]